ncbi:MAG: XrtA-associated ATPase [Gammaproteobacteria bacterium]|nr:MAG: XrtA-associated ATPase [Gammaproteobacteria bacterium]
MLDVYKSVYNLKGQPFRLSPDYRFSFGHRTYNDAKSYLKYAINEGEGIVAITGAPGTGKTTLIASLIAELDPTQVRVGVVTNVQLNTNNLVDMVVDAFSLQIDRSDGDSLMNEFTAFLIHQSAKDRRVILIVDEAQGLSAESLEELRLLSNLQHNTCLLLQIFLVGQEPLMEIVRSPGMEQLHQRLIAAAQLKPLDFEQTIDYIVHRLNCVGWDNDPAFADEALSLIHKFSAGVPRRINLITHRLFLHAGLEGKHKLVGGDALNVIVELHKEGLLTPVARRALGEYVAGIKNIAAS